MSVLQKNKTNIFIIIGWLLLYAATPLYMYYSLISTHEAVQWGVLWDTCGYITAFFLLFVIHHYVLIPFLLNNRHKVAYIACLFISFALFTSYIKYKEPEFIPRHDMHRMELHGQMPMDRLHDVKRKPHKRLPLSPPDMARMTIAILMIGADMCYAAWLNDEKMRKRLMLLEQQNLKQELEHLRYQINPHFFMNTLNNIHALVDIDPEKAKTSIVELSKLMRMILYDSDKQMTSLPQEIEFIKNYIRLMRLRFTDNVTIHTEFPNNPPHKDIAQMVLVTFIENAFKHGISYMQPTIIDIAIRLHGNKLLFTCANTVRPADKNNSNEKKGGLGLANVKKRLDLIYGNEYKLDIKGQSTRYKVRLLLTLN